MPMSFRTLRPRRRSNASFNPSSIANLAAWYDVADVNNVVINTGVNPNTISQLTDKSGNQRHATQTGTAQPQISRAAFSGKDVAAFTSARSMNMSVPLTATTTVFLVATKSSAVNTFIFGGTVGGNSPAITSEYSDVDFAYYTPGDVLIPMLANGSAGLNLLAFTHQDATNLTLYANGAFVSTRTPSAGHPYNNNSLNKLNGSGYTGSIAEFLVYNRVLSDAERWQIEGYLAWKWGVQGSLPSDHPYKNSASGQFAAMALTSSGAAILPTDYTEDGVSWRAHTFTTSGTLSFSRSGDIDYLIVAGGGGGATNCGGGGGGGGTRSGSMVVSAASQTITVGAGGSVGGNGGTSSALGISVTGGGAGGSIGNNGSAGGSGGGGGGGTSAGPRTGGAGTAGQGNAGGSSTGGSGASGGISAGGGGGATASGGNATALPAVGGTGGSGLVTSISGTSLTYGSGGGGGSDASTGFAGGSGGGTGGFFSTSAQPGQAAVSSRGGGGGGGARDGASGGAGGSGVVIVRYRV